MLACIQTFAVVALAASVSLAVPTTVYSQREDVADPSSCNSTTKIFPDMASRTGTDIQWLLEIPKDLPPKVMGSANYEFVTDPDTPQTVLRINYPQGSFRTPHKGKNTRGGAQFYISPFTPSVVKQYGQRATVEYDVYFAPGFPFHLGGKLPGIYGLNSNASARAGVTCNQGSEADGRTCWSVRIMWRKGGAGEAYVYIPLKPNKAMCKLPNTVCSSAYGISLGRGQFTFTPGEWSRIAISVNVNTPGLADGSISVSLNGETAVQTDGVVFSFANKRRSMGVLANRLDFATFYGGHTSEYAAPSDTFTLFKNIGIRLG